MKRNLLLVPFLVALALMLVTVVSADRLAGNVQTEFNGMMLDEHRTSSGMVGGVVPVRVTFDAVRDMEDVRVKVWMEGHREDIYASTDRFDIIQGVGYTKLLSLHLPSDEDDLDKVYTLYVEIVSSDDRTEVVYKITMQRESYTLGILSVDYSSQVYAGETFPVSIVAKNIGYNRADDTYVVISIPSLGIFTRGYLGDLIPVEDYDGYDDEEDSVYKTVSLQIPENALSGVYEMDIEVYNDDSSVTVTKLISIGASNTEEVIATVKSKDLNAGETVTYDLVIVNSGDSVKVFNLEAVFGDSLIVSVPSVVTVGPDSSEVVPITVTAKSDAEVGTYTFSVNVNGKSVAFGANVVSTSVTSSVVALTVVLVIIFVVLLAVLIVLLARKEKPIEEVETSYY
ncbi:MAG: hypothetical protein ABIF88_02700 [archaeon]